MNATGCRYELRNIHVNRPFPPTFAICRNCQKLRYWVGFVGVLSVNAGEHRSRSERSNPAFRVCINWCLIVFTGKIRCCFFRICAFQYFILFHVITASYLLGREQKYTAGSVSSEGDSIFYSGITAVKSGSRTVIDQFYNYRPYYVTITLQIEKYSLSFAHVGPDAPWKI